MTEKGGRFLYLQNADGPGPQLLKTLRGHRVDIVQQYESGRLDWSGYQIVMVSMVSDQVHLCEISDQISAYLDGGGTLIINGHIGRPFLPELSRYRPMEKRGLAELVIHREMEHPAFGAMDTGRMYKRRGVAGFYGRGTNPPPAGAQVLHSVGPDRLAVDWLYERPGGGRIFVHSGIELWMFLAGDMDRGPSYLQQFFDWFSSTSEIAA
ncbi:MAG: hypothetical protein ACK5IB_05305 [Qingshengfaniella sp.]